MHWKFDLAQLALACVIKHTHFGVQHSSSFKLVCCTCIVMFQGGTREREGKGRKVSGWWWWRRLMTMKNNLVKRIRWNTHKLFISRQFNCHNWVNFCVVRKDMFLFWMFKRFSRMNKKKINLIFLNQKKKKSFYGW